MATSVFVPSGSTSQKQLVNDALARCDFDWNLLLLGLRYHVGRSTIPVEWADLSRYSADAAAAESDHEHAEGEHHHEQAHIHIEEGGDTGHVLLDGARQAALGLAWYSGKVSLDLTLEGDPPLAHEVFLSEGAHMVDFFYMTPWMRSTVFAAFHNFTNVPHGHGWFEEGGNHDYWQMVGESFMAGFVYAYSDLTPTITGFTHKATPEIGEIIRETLVAPYNGRLNSPLFHQRHNGVPAEVGWSDLASAKAAGRKACPICLPGL